MNEQDNNDQGPGRLDVLAVTPERIIAACRARLCDALPSLLDDVFSRVDDALYELADKSADNSSYARYFDAMRVLRRRRSQISDSFLYTLGMGLSPPLPDLSDGRMAGSLELMPQSELEESLAISNLISKAESRYRGELAELRGRLAALGGRNSIDPRADPIGPHAICNAFRAALKLDELDPSIKLVVYKLFDKQVMDHLGAIYAQCLNCAELLEVSPGLSFQPRGAAAGTAVEDQQASEADSIPADVAGPNLEAPPILFEGLRRLLAQRPRARAPGAATVAQRELMSVLTRLQAIELPPGPAVQAPAALRESLRRELHLRGGDRQERALSAVDEDVMDLVFMLFEGIFQGSDLPDAIKALISRLQIPILKLALTDASFFDDPRHPGRSLINHLAEAASGWSPERDGINSDPYRRIEQVVERVIREFDQDPGIIRELDEELAAYIELERSQAEKRAARALEGLAGRERNRTVGKLIDEELESRLQGQERVPEAVSALLQEGWREVLLAAHQRSGPEGEEWRRALATVDRLLWSVQPKARYEDRRELLRTIPELLRTLREALAGVSYDQRRLARWFKELQALHIVALRGAALPPATVQRGQAFTPGPITGAGTEGRPGVRTPGGSTPAAGLKAGDWIEIEHDNGTLLRVRFVGRSADGVHLFVDRRGHRALELYTAELSAALTGGRVRVLGDGEGPLIDRTIEAMLRNLEAG